MPGAELDVRLRRKVEARLFTPWRPHHRIIRSGSAAGAGVVREIRHLQQQLALAGVKLPRLLFQRCDFITHLARLCFDGVGLLPFGAIFVELYFIMNSIWFSRIYYMFGFLFLCYGLMIVVCAAVTILMTYFLLCAENYNWQWRSFFAAGTSGVYIFLNCLFYLITKVKLGGVTGTVLYIGYSALISLLFFILAGKLSYPPSSK